MLEREANGRPITFQADCTILMLINSEADSNLALRYTLIHLILYLSILPSLFP